MAGDFNFADGLARVPHGASVRVDVDVDPVSFL